MCTFAIQGYKGKLLVTLLSLYLQWLYDSESTLYRVFVQIAKVPALFRLTSFPLCIIFLTWQPIRDERFHWNISTFRFSWLSRSRAQMLYNSTWQVLVYSIFRQYSMIFCNSLCLVITYNTLRNVNARRNYFFLFFLSKSWIII